MMRFSDDGAANDPILAAFDRAPVGEPYSEEIRAMLDRDMADLAAGSLELIAHDDVPAWLEARAREEGAFFAE